MGDLKTELATKVVPQLPQLTGAAIPQWTENGPDQPETEVGTITKAHGEGLGKKLTTTEQVYLSVRNYEGKPAQFHVHALNGKVQASSVSSLLRQLEGRGYVRHVGERPMRYFTTERAYEVGKTDERRREAIQRASSTRSLNAKKRRDTQARMVRKEIKRSPGVAMDPRDKEPTGQPPVPETFPPTPMAPVPQAMSAEEVVNSLNIRTARAVYDELKKLFG
jgi:hypothetical protein